jgi:hypothetical protein
VGFLVAVGEADVGKVDVERHAWREHAVGRGQRGGKRLRRGEAAVASRVQMREVEHRSRPLESAADLDHIVERAELPYPSHHLDTERDGATLGCQTLSEFPELDDHGVNRLGVFAAEQEAGMDHDRRCAACHGDPGGVVEHPDRHVVLAPAVLGVAQEGGQGSVDRERNAGAASELSQAMGVAPVHPETVAEIDLGRVITS